MVFPTTASHVGALARSRGSHMFGIVSHISEPQTTRPDRRGVVAWLITLIIVATLAIVWSERVPIVEPTPVILPTGA